MAWSSAPTVLRAPALCLRQQVWTRRLNLHMYAPRVRTAELVTPALVVQRDALEANLATMAAALPNQRLRPHVKAHKCTALATRQAAHGHSGSPQ